MTYPWPDPNPHPSGPTGPRIRRCQYCTKPAEVFDLDGSWCSSECQRMDRGSEITVWRKALAVSR